MPNFELRINLSVEADHIDHLWTRLRESGLYDLLCQLDTEDGSRTDQRLVEVLQ